MASRLKARTTVFYVAMERHHCHQLSVLGPPMTLAVRSLCPATFSCFWSTGVALRSTKASHRPAEVYVYGVVHDSNAMCVHLDMPAV